ncbi:hypothetical protein BOTCAL_0040g00130 [Botryotinia calthae]|uniref:Uncharacterized protein n=1 Tax=Botryotinia calthae TaxID=38488 RepID=A0A4Y8DC41_9HELO|nr:hypothetical protein BOTCAL_0040g00130 [Botryotinia calthae]
MTKRSFATRQSTGAVIDDPGGVIWCLLWTPLGSIKEELTMANQIPVPIAIIGIACRLPGNVCNTDDLWELLSNKKNAWSAVPAERFNEDAFYHPSPDNPGTTNHRGGHFISQDVATFDASFFGISPVEASAMDPQQRILLEVTYEAFEDAGIPIENVRGSNTGVFSAVFTRDYDRNINRDPLDIPKYNTTGTGEAIIANRVSYTFDLKGPSMTLDTGCSGSMVALHQACLSLQLGESTMALASGVNLILNPDHMVGMSNLHMLNDSGRSFPFDERGSGYGRGEGVVTVLLKRLDHAIRMGDNIRSVICSTAVNQDGKTNGITLPDSQAQESLIRLVYKNSNLDPCKIDYIEAHGTGTIAGDLAEIQTIKNVFCGDRRVSELYVGSIKSNIGHLESSSGLAGLIKAVLFLERGVILPNSDFIQEKKGLALDEWKIKIPTEPIVLGSGIRRASVNIFGYGGTNAHAVLESFDHERLSRDRQVQKRGELTHLLPTKQIITVARVPPSPQIFVLTGKSQNSVRSAVLNLSRKSIFHENLDDLAYTLSTRRSMMNWRFSSVAASGRELLASLKSVSESPNAVVRSSSPHRLVFVFTGQGAQWFGMARELLRVNSLFAQSMAESSMVLRALGASWNLVDELLAEKVDSRINESEIAQPASTALQIALIDLLSSFNVTPQVVLGHSSGEIAAAYSAGFISRREALKISYYRSFIGNRCKKLIRSKGAMLSVALGEEQVLPLISHTQKGVVSLACVNSPSSTTLSGDEEAIIEIQTMLNDLGVFSRKLMVDTAYHSHHMKKVSGEYLASLGSIHTLSGNNIEFISSVTAQRKIAGFGSQYWVDNLMSKVRFSDALENYCAAQSLVEKPLGLSSNHILVEIGPHSVLKSPLHQTITSKFDPFTYLYLPSLVRHKDSSYNTLELVKNLFDQGYPVDIDAANSIFRNKLQPAHYLPGLPTYPWDHSTKYWHESRLSRQHRLRENPYHDLLGLRIASSTSIEPAWMHILGQDQFPWLADHVVDGLVIFPGSGYFCMAIEAVSQLLESRKTSGVVPTFILRNVSFLNALIIPPSPSKVEVQLSLRLCRNSIQDSYEFKVSALGDGESWHEHCRGMIQVDYLSELAEAYIFHFSCYEKEFFDDDDDDNNLQQQDLNVETLYNQMQSNGNTYGPSFKAIRLLKMNKLKAVASIEIPNVQSIMPANYMQPHIIHPTTLDALLHTSLPLYSSIYGAGSVMPVFIGKLSLRGDINSQPGERFKSHTILNSKEIGSAFVNLCVNKADDPDLQHPILEIFEMEIRGFGEIAATKPDFQRKFSYQMKWASDIEHLHLQKEQLSLSEYMSGLHFKYSKLKILQANSDHGELARQILPIFRKFETNGIEFFDFADASNSTVNEISKEFPLFRQNMRSKILNIDSNFEDQGFESCTYNLVLLVADDMDHVSETAISNAHGLLNPGGWIMIWFKAAYASVDLLCNRLIEYDFDQTQVMNCSLGIRTIVVSRVVVPVSRTIAAPICVIGRDGTENFANQICISLQEGVIDARYLEWGTELVGNDIIRVVIDNGQCPLLVEPSSQTFQQFVGLFGARRANILWLSAHHDLSAAKNPEKGLVTGFLRSASAENEGHHHVTLDVQEPTTCLSSHFFHTIKKILIESFLSKPSPSSLLESEYVYRNEELLIPRLIPDPNVNNWIARAVGKPTVETMALLASDRTLKLDSSIANIDENIYFVREKLLESTSPLEVVVAVRAQTISRADNMANLASVPIDRISKHIRQFSGTISSIGNLTANGLRVGDRVCGWYYSNEAYASHVKLDQTNVFLLPSNISFRIGSTIPFAFMTAYYALVELAHLEKYQTLLIHDAATDLGRAALTLAQRIGAQIFVTVSNPADKEHISRQFGLRPEHVFHENGTTLKQNLYQLTNKVGVDTVLNFVKGIYNEDSFASVAKFGTYIHAVYPGESETDPESYTFKYRPMNNTTFFSLDLGNLIHARPHKLSNLLQKSTASLKLSEERLKAQNYLSVAPARLRDGFKLLSSQRHLNTFIVESNEDSQVQVINMNQSMKGFDEVTLNSDATYVISGGLGDLGQRICGLMARRGAKHIVLLSRRIADEGQMESLRTRLETLSPGCNLHSIVCDISSPSILHMAATTIEKMKLPPVKGVIQSATVLQDVIIERMSLENFQTPLKTKLHGTANLINTFKSADMDFFIMLSSLSGIIGTMGQANYDSGNVYQDTVAQNQDSSRTCFLSLDIGLIKHTSVYDGNDGELRMQNLVGQGMIPIDLSELDAVLDYTLSRQAWKDCCKQVVIGIDGASIAHAKNATPTTQSALFVHVQDTGDQVTKIRQVQDSVDRKRTIGDAVSLAEAHSILVEAIVQRVSHLISLDATKIGLDTSLVDFGLDSLTAIELKNWIGNQFDAPIQASEILDERSITSLAGKIAARSSLLHQNSRNTGEAPVAVNDHSTIPESHRISFKLLPVPDLSITLELYLKSVRMFLSETQLSHTISTIQALIDGPGLQLQNRLIEHRKQPENWPHAKMYLRSRNPINPYCIFYGSHVPGPIKHSQVEQAAIISLSAWNFKQRMDTGTLEQDYLNEEPLCMDSLKWIFNSTRLPQKTTDKMQKYADNDYFVVLRKGHVFKARLAKNLSQEVTYILLKETLEEILRRSDKNIPAVATLTADERDSWAELREVVRAADNKNISAVEEIEASTFVICLDDGSPETPTERCNKFLYGGPLNRWSDKPLQFVVFENGTSGFICEHTMLDVASLVQINNLITQSIIEYRPKDDGTEQTNVQVDGLLEEIVFERTSRIEKEIQRITENFNQVHSLPATYIQFYIPKLGSKFLQLFKIPSKAGCHLVIQLASRFHFGEQHPCWEALTTMFFRLGRVDWMQVVSPAMHEFCTSVAERQKPPAELKLLLREAVSAHSSIMTKNGRGLGFVAHCQSLEELIGEDEPVPAFFEDPTWKMTRKWGTKKIKTDSAAGLKYQEAGYLMPDPESLLVHYEVEDERCFFWVQGIGEHPKLFQKSLERAAVVVRNILEV